MSNYIIVGCDLHDKTINIRIAHNKEQSQKRSFKNSTSARKNMIDELKKRAKEVGGAKIVFAYEAGPRGFGLWDELNDAGIDCHVLAPTKIARSQKQKRAKNDDSDAQHIVEILRAYLLAGNALPKVWVPDKETRDEREIVRARLDAGEKITGVKTQIQSLLKRKSIDRPKFVGGSWTKRHRAWLRGLLGSASELRFGACVALGSLMRQLEALEAEAKQLDAIVEALGEERRYAVPARVLTEIKGVGLLTAMVFLTEMGELGRFGNRRQVGSYLGLAPSSNESGQSGERKGHITHQGPPRVRKVLCQAVWARVRYDSAEKKVYERIVARNPKHKKIAVVAAMRRLAAKMWYLGREAQERSGWRSKARQRSAA